MGEASGFIWQMRGHRAPATPTASTAPVAIERKTRRLCPGEGSAEDMAVTCASPFLSASLAANAASLPPISDATGCAPDMTPPGGGAQTAAPRLASKRLSGPPAGFY